MPDALSKTVPIWCAVINRLLFEDVLESHRVHTPNEVVGASEHAQIEARIDGFVAEAKVNLLLPVNQDPVLIFRLSVSRFLPFALPSRSPFALLGSLLTIHLQNKLLPPPNTTALSAARHLAAW